MQRKDDDVRRTHQKTGDKSGLLAKVRARTRREHDLLLSADTPHYTPAALGQSPYIAMGNGVIVVQRKCGSWGC